MPDMWATPAATPTKLEPVSTPLPDFCGLRTASGRHLPWYQSQPGSEVASTCKCRGIADRRCQGGCVQHADAGDACQAASDIIALGMAGELVVKCRDATV